MMKISRLLSFFLLSCIMTVFAQPNAIRSKNIPLRQSMQNKQCVLLGEKPSLIIHFKNIRSNENTNSSLSLTILKSLSQSGGVTFSHSKVMSGGSYILFLDINSLNNSVLPQAVQSCFTKVVINKLIKNLEKRSDVKYVDPNVLLSFAHPKAKPFRGRYTSLPPTPDKILQWNLFNANVPGSSGAWGITQGSPNVKVAVLDTGIYPHEDLNKNIDTDNAVSFYKNGDSARGASPSCTQTNCSGAYHGTFVAGIIAATGDFGPNSYKLAGVAPNSMVVPINVFSKFTSAASCYPYAAPCLNAYTSDVVNAINWLAGQYSPGGSIPEKPNNVKVINLSLGGSGNCSESARIAITYAHNAGINVVAAAGNSGENVAQFWPANCQNVISVAALDNANHRTSYSNFDNTNTIMDLAAPGGDGSGIGNEIASTGATNNYPFAKGTSFSAPMVSAAVELMYSVNATLTPEETTAILKSTASPFPISGGNYDCNGENKCGAGSLNAYAAVLEAQRTPPLPENDIIFSPLAIADLGLKEKIGPMHYCKHGFHYASELSIDKLVDGKSFSWQKTSQEQAICQQDNSYSRKMTESDNQITVTFNQWSYNLVPKDSHYICHLTEPDNYQNSLIACSASTNLNSH